MNEKVYVKGINTFAERENAPDFVLGAMVINIPVFRKWVDENQQYLSDYKGDPQLRLTITYGKDGRVNFNVDTWKPTEKKEELPTRADDYREPAKSSAKDDSGLPF